MEKEIELRFDPDNDIGKETKRTIRFEAKENEGSPEPVQTIYISKWMFKDEVPNDITLTVEY